MRKNMKRILCALLALSLFPLCALAQGIRAPLKMRLSTRTGPSTAYTEPGTFFQKNWDDTQVTVLSKAQGSGVWWVQVEFTYNGQLRRAYTGVKRVEVDLSRIPEETVLGTAFVNTAGSVPALYGPGDHYAQFRSDVPWGAEGTIIAAEEGYLLFDFFDGDKQQQRRTWVYADHLTVDWFQAPPQQSRLPNRAQIPDGAVFYWDEDPATWCRVHHYAPKYESTFIDLYIAGEDYFQNIPVIMEQRDYGMVYPGGGSGDVSFYDDQIVIDLWLPSGFAHTMIMPLSGR